MKTCDYCKENLDLYHANEQRCVLLKTFTYYLCSSCLNSLNEFMLTTPEVIELKVIQIKLLIYSNAVPNEWEHIPRDLDFNLSVLIEKESQLLLEIKKIVDNFLGNGGKVKTSSSIDLE